MGLDAKEETIVIMITQCSVALQEVSASSEKWINAYFIIQKAAISAGTEQNVLGSKTTSATFTTQMKRFHAFMEQIALIM